MRRVSIIRGIYTGGPVACNAYLLEGAEGYLLVDAPLGVAAWLKKQLPEGARLSHLLLTHQHFDHVQGAAEVQEQTGCTVHAVLPYSTSLTLEDMARGWGMPSVPAYRVDDVLGSAEQQADWGGISWKIFPIAGHAEDGVAYYAAASGELFVGDILFAGAIGRTDFPNGSTATLTRGIRRHLLPLPPETQVHCGHGPATTIGEEAACNPYL